MVTSAALLDDLTEELAERARNHRIVVETALDSPQGPRIRLADGQVLVNLCSNDYLGLANDPDVLQVAKQALDRHGFGYAAGRIICGTAAVHTHLERELSDFLGTESTQLFNSCFDANVGLFEALLGPEDVVISDSSNHASIIDGIRLCRAERLTYPTRDLAALAGALERSRSARRRLVVTDGVFSMDGGTADLAALCDLADEHDAILVVDDSHATGVLGEDGRGTVCDPGVLGRVDLVTGTLGKALGGAAGGFISGRRVLIDLLRQKARSYVFSNALPATTVEVARHALRGLLTDGDRRQRLLRNAEVLRSELRGNGLTIQDGTHPIVPIMVGDADRARAVARGVVDRGFLVVALTHPVVAPDAARIRLQVSALHERADLVAAAKAVSDVVSNLSP